MMRTTLTIDEDVAALLARLRKKPRCKPEGHRQRGLAPRIAGDGRSTETARAVRTHSVSLSRARIGGVDNIGVALAVVEGEAFH